MSDIDYPNFAELLAPFIGQVPEQAFPNFLALLERGAAERYRAWAEQQENHREGLMACAAREEEIADTVDRLFPISEILQQQVRVPLPAARDAYYAVFAGLELAQQMAIQANAELQGAAAWRGLITADSNAELRAALERCAQLEEASSAYLQEILSQ